MKHTWKEYFSGIKDSIPVGIGYFAVSFGFGAASLTSGLSAWQSTLISFTNLTSAGQFAAIKVWAEAGGLFVLFLTQLVINSRYALMSLALSQRMGKDFNLWQRLIGAFINTDEIFALAMSRAQKLTFPYYLGTGLLPLLGWTCGTLIGALAQGMVPASVQNALGIMLYMMFVAIVVPQAKKNKAILCASLLAITFSSIFTWVPILNQIQSGLAVVICTLLSATICAILFPLPDEEVAE